MATPQPISFVNTDFNSIEQQLLKRIADHGQPWKDAYESSTGKMMVRLNAYILQVLLYYVQRRSVELYPGTARLESSVRQLARLLNYQPYRVVSARGTVTFYSTTIGFEGQIVIPKYTKVTAENGTVFLTTEGAILKSDSGETYVAVVEGEPVTYPAVRVPVVQGTLSRLNTGDGQTSQGIPNQTVVLPETNIENSSLLVTVGESRLTATPWPVVTDFIQGSALAAAFRQNPDFLAAAQVPGSTTWWDEIKGLLDYANTDSVYQVVPNRDGSLTIQFGDGNFGKIPEAGLTIFVDYLLSDGGAGNVLSLDLLTAWSNGDEGLGVPPVTKPDDVNLSVTNEVSIFGGADAEPMESIRANAPRVFRTGDRAVTRQDFIDLLFSYPQVGSVNVWGEFEEQAEVTQEYIKNKLMNRVQIGMVLIGNRRANRTNDVPDSTTGKRPDQLVDGPVSLAGFEGSYEVPTATMKQDLVNRYLLSKSMLTVLYDFRTVEQIRIYPVVSIIVSPGSDTQTVLEAAEQVVLDWFWLGTTLQIGESKLGIELEGLIQAVSSNIHNLRVSLEAERSLALIGTGAAESKFGCDGTGMLVPLLPRFVRILHEGEEVLVDDGLGNIEEVDGSPLTLSTTDGANKIDYTTGKFGVDADGVITNLALPNEDLSGYGETIPAVTIDPPDGEGVAAEAVAIMANGTIVGIQIINGGSGYDPNSLPDATVAGAGEHGGDHVLVVTVEDGFSVRPLHIQSGMTSPYSLQMRYQQNATNGPGDLYPLRNQLPYLAADWSDNLAVTVES